MAQLLVPDSGLTLASHAQSSLEDATTKVNAGPPQVMQLDFPPNLLGDLLRSARKGVNVHFGKTIVSGLLNSHRQLSHALT